MEASYFVVMPLSHIDGLDPVELGDDNQDDLFCTVQIRESVLVVARLYLGLREPP